MHHPDDSTASGVMKWLVILFAAMVLVACGGGGGGGGGSGGSSDAGNQPGEVTDTQDDDATNTSELDCTTEDCRPAIQGFLAGLVNQVRSAAPLGRSPSPAQALNLQPPLADNPSARADTDTVCRPDQDEATLAVAAEQDDSVNPAELIAAFPNSSGDLRYTLTVNCTSGEIRFGNPDNAHWSVNAYDEATAFQDVDHSQIDGSSRAHTATIRFDPRVKANTIDKAVLFSQQWTKNDGSPYPQPGVSLSAGTPAQDCAADPNEQCDTIRLVTNPGVADDQPDDGNDTIEDDDGPLELDDTGIPSVLNGQPGVRAKVGGVEKSVLSSATISQIVATIEDGAYNIRAGGSDPADPDDARQLLWDIQVLKTPAGTGTWECSTDEQGVAVNYLEILADEDTLILISNAWSGGTCHIELTLASDTEVAGIFHATVIDVDTGASHTITGGAFYALVE